MYDAGKVLTGLAAFVVMVTSPFWLRVADGARAAGPPDLQIATEAKKCVAGTEFMRRHHMEMLNSWRDDVVRHDDRRYVGSDGTEYDKSLTGTCMNCHSNKREFCDRCHEYSAVSPYCWDCHVAPEEEP